MTQLAEDTLVFQSLLRSGERLRWSARPQVTSLSFKELSIGIILLAVALVGLGYPIVSITGLNVPYLSSELPLRWQPPGYVPHSQFPYIISILVGGLALWSLLSSISARHDRRHFLFALTDEKAFVKWSKRGRVGLRSIPITENGVIEVHRSGGLGHLILLPNPAEAKIEDGYFCEFHDLKETDLRAALHFLNSRQPEAQIDPRSEP